MKSLATILNKLFKSDGLLLCKHISVGFVFVAFFSTLACFAQEVADEPPSMEEVKNRIAAPVAEGFYIREFRVVGAKKLPQGDVDTAVYRYLGKSRTPEDVDKARAALEKAYHEKGYQTVSVSVPPQSVARGVIVLQVSEVPVGRVRVKGSRFYDIEKIKKMAPSLAEGSVPNFNDVQRDLIALNQSGDRQITPALSAGAVPGTVDVELIVKDKFPLHGSVELNNRYSANTKQLRLDTSLRYDNLWQLGHTIGASFQVAPERTSDALIYTGYYIARTPSISWASLMLQATRQNSEVSSLGGVNSLGNGEIYGGRLLFNLPAKSGFYHSASLGIDYKDFKQDLIIGNQTISSPLTYWPVSMNYNASLIGKSSETTFGGGFTFCFRGTSEEEALNFDNRRYNADANFFHLRGNLGHTQNLPHDFQAHADLRGQATASPLVDTEQFSLGGQDTVRGYLESAVTGDNALGGTFELRSPSLLGWLPKGNEGRLFAFIDGGYAMLNEPLPEQTSEFTLWSYGVGARLQLVERLNGTFSIGIPQITQSATKANHPRFSFSISAEL